MSSDFLNKILQKIIRFLLKFPQFCEVEVFLKMKGGNRRNRGLREGLKNPEPPGWVPLLQHEKLFANRLLTALIS